MNVKQRMTANPITISPQATHREAVEVLRANRIRRLPVVDAQGKLVGIITENDILSTSPSPATTLSIYEIYTLLDQLKVEQFMTTPVMVVDEECGIAEAARFMIENRISALPVMRGDELVGIITETDIFKTFVEVLGGGVPGARFDVRTPDRRGMLASIAQATTDAGGNIVALTTFRGDDPQHAFISIKERGADVERLKGLLGSLEGVEVIDFRTADDGHFLRKVGRS